MYLQEEARRHFDCPSLTGVELENQGESGTMGEHWEKRVLGVSDYRRVSNTHDFTSHYFQNEAMTGQLTFNPVFSRFTFAALEDSGYAKRWGGGVWSLA